MSDYHVRADQNLDFLRRNPYPGRGFVIGVSSSDLMIVMVYWIMGRSETSRNRVFSVDGGRVYTELADPTKFKGDERELELILYNAMDDGDGVAVVSNGKQTDSVTSYVRFMNYGKLDLDKALGPWKYEPDAPNFTPRITGVCSREGSRVPSFLKISVLRKAPWNDYCDRSTYEYCGVEQGLGLCVTTYQGDGSPLPAFRDEPYMMPLQGDIEQIAKTYWDALNKDNRVSLAVKFFDPETHTSQIHHINKYEKQFALPHA